MRLVRSSLALATAVLLSSALTVHAQQGAAAPTGNPDNGKKAFKANGCFACHGLSGDGGISPYPTQSSSRQPRPSVTGAHIAGMPLPFQAFVNYVRKPSGRMPAFGTSITDTDLADIYAFLKSMPAPPDPKTTPLLNAP